METQPSPYIKQLYVCINQREDGSACCANRQGVEIREKLKRYVNEHGLKGRVRVSKSGCMDLCAKGANVMVAPNHTWYSGVTLDSVDQIIEKELVPLEHPDQDPSGKPAVRAFLFDLGNVLFSFDHMRAARVITEGSSATPEALYKKFFNSPLVVDHDEGRISTRKFFAILQKEIGLDIPYDRFLVVWNDIFTEIKPMADLVHYLAEQYPLFLISNTNRPHFEFLREQSSALERFDAWILSYEVGHLKPHPAIYHRALEVAKLPASEMLYIDDREDLIAAGKKMGFQTHRFTEFTSLEADLTSRGFLNGA